MGVVRRVDRLGRVVIPKGILRSLGMEPGTPLSVFVDESRVVLARYSPGCVFCGSIEGVVTFRGQGLCLSCARRIAREVAGARFS
jgi:transcriptional pleiotropic regulator of transition state genes